MKKKRLILFILISLGIFLRIYRLGTKDFWFDEAGKLLVRENPYIWLAMLRPLFNISLYFWLKVIPNTEFYIRLLPCISGIASLPIFYMYGRKVFNEKIALFGTFLLSISPLHIWYSQELKGYTLATLLTILAAYFFFRYIKEERLSDWIALTITTVFLIYTTYLSFSVLLTEIVFILLTKRKDKKLYMKWFIQLSIVSICFLPRLPHLLWRFGTIKESFWIEQVSLQTIWATFANFNLGYTGTHFLFQFSLLLTLPVLIFALLKIRRDKEILLNSLFFFIPIAFAVLFSFLSTPIFITRQFVQFTPFYYLLIGKGFNDMRWRMGKFLYIPVLLIPLSFSLFYLYSNLMPSNYVYHIGTYPKRSFKNIAEYILSSAKEYDIVAHSNPSTTLPLEYYMRKNKLPHYYFILPSHQDFFWRRNIMEIKIPENIIHFISYIDLSKIDNLQTIEPKATRVWLISSSWARDGRIDEHSEKVREWMRENFKSIEERWMDGVLIGLYGLK